MNFVFDFHIHSKFSFDSMMNPKKIIKVAKKKKMSGVAITDHNTIKGSLIARKYCNDKFFVIIGTEIKTEIGDLIGLFINEEIKTQRSVEVIDEIKDQGGIVVLPHPFRAHELKKVDDTLIRKIDVIEGFNARTKHILNIQAYNFAIEHNLPIIAGSDAHFQSEIGLGKTIIKDVYDMEDIRKKILQADTEMYCNQASRYIIEASKFVEPIKTGKLYKLPYILLDLTLKWIKYQYKKNMQNALK